jgi:hypothetical protein
MTLDLDERDRAYTAGERAAWSALLRTALRELGDEAPDAARLALEREETLSKLRQVCEEFGDTDWPDNLHLRDVIEKHLLPYLDDEP